MVCEYCSKFFDTKYCIEKGRDEFIKRKTLFDCIDYIKYQLIKIQLNNSIYECSYCKNSFKKLSREYIDSLYELFINQIIEKNLVDNLSETEEFEIMYIINKYQKNKNYYFKKIFGIPFYLYEIGIPKDNYLFRKNNYFNDLIAGNPMASHGWFYDSLQSMKDNGIELEN